MSAGESWSEVDRARLLGCGCACFLSMLYQAKEELRRGDADAAAILVSVSGLAFTAAIYLAPISISPDIGWVNYLRGPFGGEVLAIGIIGLCGVIGVGGALGGYGIGGVSSAIGFWGIGEMVGTWSQQLRTLWEGIVLASQERIAEVTKKSAAAAKAKAEAAAKKKKETGAGGGRRGRPDRRLSGVRLGPGCTFPAKHRPEWWTRNNTCRSRGP